MGVYFLSGKLYLRIPCSYTNRSGTPSWTMLLSMCKKERILTTATKTHAVVWGIFSSRAFLFADSRRSNKSRNNWTTTAKRLTAGWARGTVCWFLSTIDIANFLVQDRFNICRRSSRSNVASHSNLASYYANFLRPIFYLCVIRE